VPGKPTHHRHLNNATRILGRALRQEAENAQLRYIEKLSPTSTKHPLWKAYLNLSSLIETVTPIRNSSGNWLRRDEDRAENFALHLSSLRSSMAQWPYAQNQNSSA